MFKFKEGSFKVTDTTGMFEVSSVTVTLQICLTPESTEETVISALPVPAAIIL